MDFWDLLGITDVNNNNNDDDGTQVVQSEEMVKKGWVTFIHGGLVTVGKGRVVIEPSPYHQQEKG